MSYYSPAVICYGPHTVEAGEGFTLRYRVLVHDGRWDAERLKAESKRFVGRLETLEPSTLDTPTEGPSAQLPMGETGAASPLLDEHNYQARQRELTVRIAALAEQAVEAGRQLEQYEVDFRKAAEAHPARKAYLEAMAATEPVRAALAEVERQITDKEQELARAQQDTKRALAKLEAQRHRTLAELQASFEAQLWEAEHDDAMDEEIREIRRDHTKLRGTTNLRYDTLKSNLEQKRSSAEQKIRDGIGPLEAKAGRIKTDQLAPAMAKAAPFQVFLTQEQQKREMLEGRLGALRQELAGAEKRLKNLPKPRPAEDIAVGRLKMAKAVLRQNPEAARKRLAEIVAKYPETKAANQAAALLKELDAGQP
jgi:hypothetical protein